MPTLAQPQAQAVGLRAFCCIYTLLAKVVQPIIYFFSFDRELPVGCGSPIDSVK